MEHRRKAALQSQPRGVLQQGVYDECQCLVSWIAPEQRPL